MSKDALELAQIIFFCWPCHILAIPKPRKEESVVRNMSKYTVINV